MNRKTLISVGAILILIALLTACQSKLLSEEGQFVAEDHRIALPLGGSASGNWQGKADLMVEYTVTTTPQLLQIAGEIVFNREQRLSIFTCSLVLIDANGLTLTVDGIATAGGREDYIQRVQFSHEMQLPPASRYFAFSYNGETSGTGNGGSPNSFWASPW